MHHHAQAPSSTVLRSSTTPLSAPPWAARVCPLKGLVASVSRQYRESRPCEAACPLNLSSAAARRPARAAAPPLPPLPSLKERPPACLPACLCVRAPLRWAEHRAELLLLGPAGTWVPGHEPPAPRGAATSLPPGSSPDAACGLSPEQQGAYAETQVKKVGGMRPRGWEPGAAWGLDRGAGAEIGGGEGG